MRLDVLLAGVDLTAAGTPIRQVLGDPAGTDVTALTLDSRAVVPGTLFCCVPGDHYDGHDFAPQAVAAGATALLSQRPLDLPVPQVVVERVRPALGPLAAAVHGHPSRAITVIGVTGTNGKTTTTLLLESVFGAARLAAATIGTLSGARTTPDAPVLQAALAAFRAEGRAAVVMEVSSHALVQHRVDAVWFAAAIFTNLTQDHLDYHATMEEYFEAKARLFEPGRAAMAVINADDPWGERLLSRLRRRTGGGASRLPAIPFSLNDLEGLVISPEGSRFRWRGTELRVRLGGRFNVRNALAAATAAAALGIERDAIATGLEQVQAVRGRFEPVRAGQPFTVLVDYAHTPDGLEQALIAARELAGPSTGPSTGPPTGGRVIVVFGAGGDRDPTKRPMMGEVTTRMADLAVLTSDNPRGEDPLAIIAQVAAGANHDAQLEVEPDRERAIGLALARAQADDVVVIAGKGHEIVQEVAGRNIAFDDALVARRALAQIGRDRGTW